MYRKFIIILIILILTLNNVYSQSNIINKNLSNSLVSMQTNFSNELISKSEKNQFYNPISPLISFLNRGGIFMYPLFILSILGVAIIIERFIIFGVRKISFLHLEEIIDFLIEYYNYTPVNEKKIIVKNYSGIKNKIKDNLKIIKFFILQLELYEKNLPIKYQKGYFISKILNHKVIRNIKKEIKEKINKFINSENDNKNLQKIIEKIEKGIVITIKELGNNNLYIPEIFKNYIGLLIENRENINYEIERFEKNVEIESQIKIKILEKNLNVLATISNLAPLLGFLGTISGMIQAFSSITKMEKVTPSIVAGGIYEALLTTEYGLVIAIVILFFLMIFESRLNYFIKTLEHTANSLIEIILYKNKGEK